MSCFGFLYLMFAVFRPIARQKRKPMVPVSEAKASAAVWYLFWPRVGQQSVE